MRMPWRRSAGPPEGCLDLPPDAQEPKPRVLLCDDNASVTQLLELMLSLEGWAVETTTDGPECLESLDREPPEVIVLDQRMPGMSGIEVAQAARERGFDRPILLFSGHLERDEWKRLDTLGLLPVSKVDFPAVVRHVTAARRQYVNRTRAAARGGDGEQPG